MADHERTLELTGYVTDGHHVTVDMRKMTGRWLGAAKTLDNADMEALCGHIAGVLCGGDIAYDRDTLLDLPAADLLEIVKGVSGLAMTPKSGTK